MVSFNCFIGAVTLAVLTSGVALAQDAEAPAETADATQADMSETEGLLSPENLQDLVAPIALYPDTLLIQILVASTYPLEIVKADGFLAANEGADPKALKDDIELQDWDESVAVLASAFPDVLHDMSDNIDWTDQLGTAMLAQDQDVMDAVQVMRETAQEAGNLESNDYQTVEVTQEGNAGDTIIIQPAEPEVVYVPTYDTEKVYVEDTSSNTGDAIAAGLFAFTTFVVLDSIFDNDDPWNDYWGCRNCGGWGGGPIIRNPDIDIDVDGDVNIGNNVVGWKPEDGRRDEARDKIADRDGAERKEARGSGDRGDQMRESLSDRTGAKDISTDRAAAAGVASQVDRGKIERPGGLSQADRSDIANRTKSATRSGGGTAASRPSVNKPRASSAPKRQASSNRGGALQKSGSASRAQAGSARGRAAAGGRSGGGRLR